MRASATTILAGAFLAVSSVFPALAESFRNPDGVAAIIGNRAYEHRDVPDVKYAHRDAEAFRRYVADVLGFDPENVLDLRDATKAQLESAFGNERSHRGLLWRSLAPDGGSDIVVFYSGHGVPGVNDGRGYLLPSDTDAATAEINGYPIDVLLSNLDRLEDEARSVRVYLDACFSGSSHSGLLVRNISGPVIVELREVEPESRMTVLTAASGDQVASWDEKAGHGLFTHHLLDALYGLGDADGDGSVTAGEARSWLDDYMTRAARRSLGRIQEADLVGDGSAVLASSEGGFPARPVLPPDPADVPFEVAPLDDVLIALSDVSARLGPGVAYEAAGTIARDAEVTVTGSVTVSGVGWLRVSLPGGGAAFVPASALGERGPAPEAVGAALGLSRSDRVLVQRGLAHLGFDTGPADGVFGRRTRGAIESYQRDKGLPATGYLTAELGDALIALGGAAQRDDEADVRLDGGFLPDPHRAELRVSGNVAAPGGCRRYVSGASADYRVEYVPTQYMLSFWVESEVDTVLCIETPSGDFVYNDDHDDGSGGAPGIRFGSPDAGVYSVWVGTFTEGNSAAAVLHVTEAGLFHVDDGPNSCRYARDGECDEPNLCDLGTDTADCRGTSGSSRSSGSNSCEFAYDGECDEPRLCARGTDTFDCRL